MALRLLMGCQSHNAYGPGKDAGADGKKTLAGVVSYIRQHEQRMPYLQERNFSANDLVVSKADCSITDDTIYVKIPFVRPLRDSLATADSLFFAPRRILPGHASSRGVHSLSCGLSNSTLHATITRSTAPVSDTRLSLER